MKSNRERMDKEIQTVVVQLLKTRRFKGTYPHFFTEKKRTILIFLCFQHYSRGGKFVVEISYVDKQLKNVWSIEKKPSEYKVYDCKERLRLGSSEITKGDYWFEYPSQVFPWSNPYKKLASNVAALIETQGEKWRKNHS